MSARQPGQADAIANRKGAVIHKAVVEFKVSQWLAGSKAVGDRPTLAELEQAGYRVVPADQVQS